MELVQKSKILSYLFTPSFTKLLDQKSTNKIISKVQNILNSSELEADINIKDKTILGLLTYCYEFIEKYYKCEYIYKNKITNQILIQKHDIYNTALFSEFRVNKSKVDLFMINGYSCAYEIKTEIDSLERLDKQLDDYLKYFEYVNVVCGPDKVDKLLNEIPSQVGLILNNGQLLKEVKHPTYNLDNICLKERYRSLRKSEIIEVISSFYGSCPNLSTYDIYSHCEPLFCDIPKDKAVKLSNQAMKKRIKRAEILKFIVDLPKAIQFLIFNCKLNLKSLDRIQSNLALPLQI